MLVKNFDENKKRILKFLKNEHEGVRGSLYPIIKTTLTKKKAILNLVKKHGTPFYAFDAEEVKKSVNAFRAPFRKHIPNCHFFYALKSDYHPFLLKEVVKNGMHLDVSSKRELEFALEAGAKQIIFTGPGKGVEDLRLALKHHEKMTINIDSFHELKRLGELTNKNKKNIRAAVRFFSSYHGSWSKFGIPMNELKKFWQEAKKYPYIQLQGLHFHTSHNRTPKRYIDVIKELSEYLKEKGNEEILQSIKFIDMGGGYYPNRVEGYFPWSSSYNWTRTVGHIVQFVNEVEGKSTEFEEGYYITESATPEEYAKDIAQGIKTYLKPLLPKCEYYFEPGRIVSNNAMHMVVKVEDVKGNGIITDGGLNMMGWEFGMNFYYPIVNLTHPAKTELRRTLYGPLCTPRDVWGYYCYANKIMIDDIIVIPNQGAYKFTMAQNFIREVPPVYKLKK